MSARKYQEVTDRVTDQDVDRYIPNYREMGDYPAYRSGAIERREQTDNRRRFHAVDDNIGVELHDGMVAPGAGRGSCALKDTLKARSDDELEEWIELLQLDPDVEEVLRLRLQRKSFDEIALERGITKSKVDRMIESVQHRWYEIHIQHLLRADFGEAEVIQAAFAHRIFGRVAKTGYVARRKCWKCGGAEFSETFMNVGANRNIKRYMCDTTGCKTVYTPAEYAKLGAGLNRMSKVR